MNVLQGAQTNVVVLDMRHEDFFETELQVSQYMLSKMNPRPYMDRIKQVIIRKGSHMMKYGETLEPNVDVKSVMLFTKKQLEMVTSDTFDLGTTLKFQQKSRGIDTNRKKALLNVVLPVIENEKKAFWENLAENEGGADEDEEE